MGDKEDMGDKEAIFLSFFLGITLLTTPLVVQS
ncbi:hypothetical protein FIS3754_41810 [Fischerella sp. NIES-3754]|nr:hypothetical protein FIS3754_41810 [Fischerella sp. NIES-3754]